MDGSGESSKGVKLVSPGELLTLQVRAFIDAAEDVDVDEETIDDLVQVLAQSEADAALPGNLQPPDSHSADAGPNDGEAFSEHELFLAALYGVPEDEPTWSKQDIREMLRYLKEYGMSAWVDKYVILREIPIPKLLLAFGMQLCPELAERTNSTLLYFLRVALSRELRLRDKIRQHNTLDDAVHLIANAQRIIILTGAGISVSCGIPDFRSRDGVYAMLKNEGKYDLEEPQQMFDINYFKENPSVFYSFASQIYPSNFTPSACHKFIKLVEDKGKLLRNYTQNIDTLETKAGVKRVLQCHGSFATASCLLCRRRVVGTEIEHEILSHKVPICTVCNVPKPAKAKARKKKSKKKQRGEWDSAEEDESDGPDYPPSIMKPDITFFGEKLTDEFDKLLAEDREKVDLLLVIGTSLKVSPVADIVYHLPHSVPQILINKTPIRHINPDIMLLGDADGIISYLSQELRWGSRDAPSATKQAKRPLNGTLEPERVKNSHVWLFPGAEGGRWLEEYERTLEPTTASTPSEITSREAKRTKIG